MKKPVNKANRRRLWEELTELTQKAQPENMSPYVWSRLKYTAPKLATFSLEEGERPSKAAKRLLRIVWGFDEWHELNKLDAYYTDAIHLIKDVTDLWKNHRQPLKVLCELSSVPRLSDDCHFSGNNLRKEYFAARRIWNITKGEQVADLLQFIRENGYDFALAKEDVRTSEKILYSLTDKWVEHLSSLKNS